LEPERSAPANRKAVYSVVFGALAFACSFLSGFGAFVLAVPALTTGVHARREIRASKGVQNGDLLAVAGLTMGATTIGLLLISWIVSPMLG
jgi:hypothetical protein